MCATGKRVDEDGSLCVAGFQHLEPLSREAQASFWPEPRGAIRRSYLTCTKSVL